MDEVVMEVRQPDGVWARVGSVGEPEPLGSVSSEEPQGRRVLVFGWHGDSPGVWESSGGWDVETPMARVVGSVGLELCSDLAEPYCVEICREGVWVPLRFTLI